MSERFDLGHIESCMGGNLKSPLFDLEQYSQRMKVGGWVWEVCCALWVLCGRVCRSLEVNGGCVA
jgi:hypothetical protein